LPGHQQPITAVADKRVASSYTSQPGGRSGYFYGTYGSNYGS